DFEALLSAPAWLLRSTGTTTFTGALGAVITPSQSPLVEGDRLQAFRLAKEALPRALAEPEDPAPRVDLCAAALLANRAEDDDTGRRTARNPIGGGSYALATALHLRFEHVGQGEATAALTPTVVRRLGPEHAAATARLAEALGIEGDARSHEALSEACAEALSAFYRAIGMPARVRDLNIPRETLPMLAQDTLKNFNANAGLRADDQRQTALALLEAAW
ncbi:MAG TPA: iron-containing alcohol dehydrogenase, partial [Dehalococcoidia bacterium]|nr:iron-containing alcohol dehydrogenase [Dehalococcoidia bacterium]